MKTHSYISNNNYQWYRSRKGRWINDLRLNGQIIATLTFAGENDSRAWVEYNDHSLVFERDTHVFGSSIHVRDEDTAMRICTIRNLKWYALAKGVVDFDNKQLFYWEISNFPTISFIISDNEHKKVVEYKLNEDHNRFNIIIHNRTVEENLLVLFMLIGWYCAPKLNTVDYALPDKMLQTIDSSVI